jgi:hypothetical protein
VEIPSWTGLSGPQLAAVPGLFGWESLDGRDFLGHNLLLSQVSFDGNPLMDGIFWATTCCCLKPLSSRWNFGYHEAFLTNFFSFSTMEFWLSRSLSRELFPFFTMEFWLSRSLSHELFFFFHDGILAITKPFSRTFLFSRWNSVYHEAFLTNFFLFSRWNSRNLGEDSFHIYITKSIYIGSASLKTLPLDLEPPLQGKEYGPSYSDATRKSNTSFCSEITYRHVIRIF